MKDVNDKIGKIVQSSRYTTKYVVSSAPSSQPEDKVHKLKQREATHFPGGDAKPQARHALAVL